MGVMSHAFGGRTLVRFGTSLTITCDLEVPVALLQVTGSWFAVHQTTGSTHILQTFEPIILHDCLVY